MKFSKAVLTTLAATSMAATITHYHTVYNTIYHTHTIYSTHYKTVTGDNNEATTVAYTTEATTSTEAAVPTADETKTTTSSTSSTSSTKAAATTEAATTTTSATKAAETTSSTSTTSASASSTPTSTFASEILNEHNVKRALHGVSNLTWSSTLEEYAQNYANQYDCSSGTLVHSGGPYGENLALGYDTIPAVDAWYAEIQYYDWSNPGFSEQTGHFTQVVWKDSTEVGCGYVDCGSYYGQYTICSYNPAGNVIGYFEENVLPLVSSD